MIERTSTEPVIVFSLGVAKDLTDYSTKASLLAKVFRTFGISCIQVLPSMPLGINIF